MLYNVIGGTGMLGALLLVNGSEAFYTQNWLGACKIDLIDYWVTIESIN